MLDVSALERRLLRDCARIVVCACVLVGLVVVLLLAGCCSSSPLEEAPELGPDLACGRLAPACTFVDGGIAPCDVTVAGEQCYVGRVEQQRCAPDPLVVPKGYPYFVVADCALCASTCPP